MKIYEPPAGGNIKDAINKIVLLANDHRDVVSMEFNSQTVTARPGDSANMLYDEWLRELERRQDAYERSPAGIAARIARDEANRKAREFQARGLSEFSVRDAATWEKWVDANRDPYGAACIRYAAHWAHIMEERLTGTTVADIAQRASHDADVEGITGFMYGVAVQMLAQCWEHGEELRRWHNLETQVCDEGERANKSGGVLNPAILCIGEKNDG